jgi:hypothetical protein
MYNEELKTKFLDEYAADEGVKKKLVGWFQKIEPEENKKGRDFCTWTRNEILSIFDKVVSARASGQQMILFELGMYIKWCLKNNIEGARKDLLDIKAGDLPSEKIRGQMVANPRHLQRYLDCIFDPEDMETADCTYRCFLWLAYIGVYDDEVAIKIKDDDVDLVKQVVVYNETEYPIYKEALPVFKKCKELKRFNQVFPNYKDRVTVKLRVDGNELLRGAKDPARGMRVGKFRVALLRANKEKDKKFNEEYLKENKLDIRISYSRAWLSGVFYRMYEDERAGIPVDFVPIAKYMILTNGYNGAQIQFNAQVNRNARFLSVDYKRWKQAYTI